MAALKKRDMIYEWSLRIFYVYIVQSWARTHNIAKKKYSKLHFMLMIWHLPDSKFIKDPKMY